MRVAIIKAINSKSNFFLFVEFVELVQDKIDIRMLDNEKCVIDVSDIKLDFTISH